LFSPDATAEHSTSYNNRGVPYSLSSLQKDLHHRRAISCGDGHIILSWFLKKNIRTVKHFLKRSCLTLNRLIAVGIILLLIFPLTHIMFSFTFPLNGSAFPSIKSNKGKFVHGPARNAPKTIGKRRSSGMPHLFWALSKQEIIFGVFPAKNNFVNLLIPYIGVGGTSLTAFSFRCPSFSCQLAAADGATCCRRIRRGKSATPFYPS